MIRAIKTCLGINPRTLPYGHRMQAQWQPTHVSRHHALNGVLCDKKIEPTEVIVSITDSEIEVRILPRKVTCRVIDISASMDTQSGAETDMAE